jgi:group I intron endonuclease
VRLARRLRDYYTYSYLTKNKMIISKALLKYGYSNFKLEILEYCEPKDVIKREQHYLDLLEPEYNQLKIAGSNLGYKHTEETLAKFRARELSEEHRAKLQDHLAKHNSPHIIYI